MIYFDSLLRSSASTFDQIKQSSAFLGMKADLREEQQSELRAHWSQIKNNQARQILPKYCSQRFEKARYLRGNTYELATGSAIIALGSYT